MKFNRIKIAAVALLMIVMLSSCEAIRIDSPITTGSDISTTASVSATTAATTSATTTTAAKTTIATTTTKPATTTAKTTSVATTTTKPTTTTAKTTAVTTTVPVVEEIDVPVLSNISNRSVINYTYGVKNFKTSKNLVLYDFSDKKDTGVSRDGTINPIRMHYGITASLNGNKISFATYNDYPSVCNVSVKAIEIMSDTKISSVKISDKTMTLDTTGYANGLYSIRVTYSNNKKLALMFYVNDGKTYLCSADTMTNSELTAFKTRRDTIDKLLANKNLTPDNCTDTSNLSYPHCDRYGYNSDTQEWITLSFEITKPEWSDARKMFAIHEWMCENLAYDYYRVNVLGAPRAFYYNDFSGTYDTWTTKIGVCHDFVNIFATMCRAQGIPCNTIDNRGHTWNLAYINGSWVEVDMTVDINNGVYGKDMTKWSEPTTVYEYSAYADENVNGLTELIVINDCLWDYAVFDGTKPVIGTHY